MRSVTLAALAVLLVMAPAFGQQAQPVVKYRQPWFKQDSYDNPLSNQFRKLLDETGLYRRGRTFYALRHTFETVAGESRDQVAVDFVMGHLRDDMATIYREKISDDRLEAVSNTVRRWWKSAW